MLLTEGHNGVHKVTTELFRFGCWQVLNPLQVDTVAGPGKNINTMLVLMKMSSCWAWKEHQDNAGADENVQLLGLEGTSIQCWC